MSKTTTDAVQILRFFETEPIERAEIVFDIVTDKMRERLAGRRAERSVPEKGSTGRRRRDEPANTATAGGDTSKVSAA